jgi:hypothetical protein
MASWCQSSGFFNAQARISPHLASIGHSNDGPIDFVTASRFFFGGQFGQGFGNWRSKGLKCTVVNYQLHSI